METMEVSTTIIPGGPGMQITDDPVIEEAAEASEIQLEETPMNTYILFMRFTQLGIENVKLVIAHLNIGGQEIEGLGGRVKANYLMMGPYDLFTIIEAPDDQTVAQITYKLSLRGYIRSEAYRAFNEAEIQALAAAMNPPPMQGPVEGLPLDKTP